MKIYMVVNFKVSKINRRKLLQIISIKKNKKQSSQVPYDHHGMVFLATDMLWQSHPEIAPIPVKLNERTLYE